MGINRCDMAQASLQPDLARGRRQQIGAAHDMRNALKSIIHHHRQLVREQAIGS